MSTFQFDFCFENEAEVIRKLKKLDKEDMKRLDAIIFGNVILKMDSEVIHSPFYKSHNLLSNSTDSLWLLKTYYDILKILSNGITQERQSVPFIDNPLELSFIRKSDKIEISFNYRPGNERELPTPIKSIIISERQLCNNMILSSKRLYDFIFEANRELINNPFLVRFKKIIERLEKE